MITIRDTNGRILATMSSMAGMAVMAVLCLHRARAGLLVGGCERQWGGFRNDCVCWSVRGPSPAVSMAREVRIRCLIILTPLRIALAMLR
jgi:hypothetical protein